MRSIVMGLFLSWICGVSLSCTATPEATTPPDSPASPALIAPTPTPAAAPPVEATLPPEQQALWSRLQQADSHYFVLMRHAIAPGTGDPASFKLDDCTTQRNLSDEGRDQARQTGDLFRQQGVEVTQVLSSQWCRCLETAELMALGEVQPFPPLNSFFRDRATEPQQTQAVREFMREQADTPGVTVMVTHFVNIAALSGSGVSSGAIVVMQVNEQEQLEVVGQLEAL